MIRKMIQIDKDKCNGCGLCAQACHEGAIGMVGGKAELLRDDYCDGLGDCLPVCPTGAITFVSREAAAYDEAAVKASLRAKPLACGYPGTHAKALEKTDAPAEAGAAQPLSSQLGQWPVQIKLVPANAPYFHDAHLLVAADCCAYAFADFHRAFIRGKITLIGCPKLDSVDYTEKLTEIIKNNEIKSVTVVRMEVPCCGGLENAVKSALQASGKFLPWQVKTISTDGNILE